MSLKKFFVFNKCVLATMVMMAAVMAAIAQQTEEQRIKEFEAKHPNGIIVTAKILSVDAIKGDVSIRLEFVPDGDLIKEDGTLAKTLKLDTLSSNGKQEVTFEKGKRMNATEALLSMYGDPVEKYPFDEMKADLMIYFLTKPDKKKEGEAPKTDAPKPEAPAAEGEADPKPAAEEEPVEEEVPFLLVFNPTAPGFTITAEKSKDSDDSYLYSTLTISRSIMVKAFSVFVMLLMWGVTLAVVALVGMVVIGGRKVEIAMFSFIATLLFAFVAVRNSQPSIPPIGINIDYVSFFLAEFVLAACLLSILATWILRKPA
jgi:hypothetical protein